MPAKNDPIRTSCNQITVALSPALSATLAPLCTKLRIPLDRFVEFAVESMVESTITDVAVRRGVVASLASDSIVRAIADSEAAASLRRGRIELAHNLKPLSV